MHTAQAGLSPRAVPASSASTGAGLGRTCACYGSDGGELAGGPVASMIWQQPYLNRPAVWGVFARTLVLGDVMWELVQVVHHGLQAGRLPRAGSASPGRSWALPPWLDLFASQGHAYVAPPGEAPSPLGEQAPPFALTQTTERWQLARRLPGEPLSPGSAWWRKSPGGSR